MTNQHNPCWTNLTVKGYQNVHLEFLGLEKHWLATVTLETVTLEYLASTTRQPRINNPLHRWLQLSLFTVGVLRQSKQRESETALLTTGNVGAAFSPSRCWIIGSKHSMNGKKNVERRHAGGVYTQHRLTHSCSVSYLGRKNISYVARANCWGLSQAAHLSIRMSCPGPSPLTLHIHK